MRYRVLIVDDEPEIRQGLRLKVDWESLRLVVAGEASNGIEALERLANEAIDIVITDMNMPVMNGVSFLESCHEHYPALRLIVITGYEDFQYARAAIRNQARDYLLKPVSQDELTAALSKVTRELDEERNFQDQQETVQWRLSQYYKEMKEHFIVHIVKEELEHGRTVLDRSKLFQLDEWGGKSVRFLTAGLRERSVHSTSEERTPDKLRLPFEMICREFAETYPEEQPQIFRDANYPGLIHFIFANDEPAIEAFAEALRLCVTGHLAFEPVIGIGQPVTGFTGWKEGYISALLAWNLSESDVRFTPREQSDGKAVLTEDTAKVIQMYLTRGELALFEQTVRKELAEAFYESQSHFVKLIFQLYLLLDSMAYAAGVRLDSGEQLWVRPEMVLGLDTVEKAGQFMMRLGNKIHGNSNAGLEDSDNSMIRAAKQFIDKNYMYDLHLTMLAERFNYNPSYFSELFKAKVGKTFIQYMTEVRMAQAVHLLENTALNLWDIAELTGFSNASYFSSKFKRMYGMTPSDFRQKSPEKINSEEPKK
ncbi:MAG: YesN8 [Paenibacillus sp.]|jgi:two-component system response regulator YesN|nr:YesN8 [Paenibacillus sp.]